MRFDTAVDGAAWDEADALWVVKLAGGETLRARYLVDRDRLPVAAAHARHPRASTSFAGKIIHTAAWDDDYDLAGKRVAVIGTGATAVQLIPELAQVVGELTVYPAHADLGRAEDRRPDPAASVQRCSRACRSRSGRRDWSAPACSSC